MAPFLVVLLALVAGAVGDGCNLRADRCDGSYIINDEPGRERFYVHFEKVWWTPWKRVSDVALCGTAACDKTISYQMSSSTTATDSRGQTVTIGESSSTTDTESLALAVKVGLSGKFLGMGASVDTTTTVTGSRAVMTGASSSNAESATFSLATGETFGQTDSLTCKGSAGDKMYVEAKRRWMELKGNHCSFNYRDSDNGDEVWNCRYLELEMKAFIPGSQKLDVQARCTREKDADVSLGCRSKAGPTYADFCRTNGAMGHCPATHCEQ